MTTTARIKGLERLEVADADAMTASKQLSQVDALEPTRQAQPIKGNVDEQNADSSAPIASSSSEEWMKCSQCSFYGPVSSFPLRMNGTGHVRTCAKHSRSTKRQDQQDTSAMKTSLESLETPLSWDSLLEDIQTQAIGQIEIDSFVSVPPDHLGANGETLLIRSNAIMDSVKHAAGYRFNYKRRQDSTQKAERSSVFTYYCSQLEGEQTKHILHPDESKRRPKKVPKMPRFNCNGWASITVSENMPTTARVRLTHAFAHVAVFSQRASGAGVGATNPLKPQLTPADLVTLEPTENEDLQISALGAADDNQPQAQSLIAPPPKKRGRKRKRNETETALDTSQPSTLSDSLPTNYISRRGSHSTPISPPTSYSTPQPSAPSVVMDATGYKNYPADELVHASGYSSDQTAISWPSNAPHQHRISRFPPNHHPYTQQHVLLQPNPPLPGTSHSNDIQLRARVLFPAEYLNELRRTITVAFAEAERPGGMTIEEARAFELAFAPVAQLARDFEARQDTIHPGLRGGPAP